MVMIFCKRCCKDAVHAHRYIVCKPFVQMKVAPQWEQTDNNQKVAQRNVLTEGSQRWTFSSNVRMIF